MPERHFPRLCWTVEETQTFTNCMVPTPWGNIHEEDAAALELNAGPCTRTVTVGWSWLPQAFRNQLCASCPAPLSGTCVCVWKRHQQTLRPGLPLPRRPAHHSLPRRRSHRLLYTCPLTSLERPPEPLFLTTRMPGILPHYHAKHDL